MENGFLQRRWSRVTTGQQLQFRKKVLMFSVFLLISVFIWLLNALSKSYTDVIEYPLVYTDFPEDKVFVGELPKELELRINAHGYAILRYKAFKKPVPISFKVSAFTLNRPGQDTSRAYILTRYLREQVSSQLPAELQLLEIKPDTLHFQFARRVTKMVRIQPDISYELDNRFVLKGGIRFDPDSIEVTGPDLILDTLTRVFTEKIELGSLSRNFNDRVRIKKLGELEYGRSRVNCSIELERFTEVQLTIPVEVLNLPDTLTLQTFPAQVKLTCNVGLSMYDRVDANTIRAVVDYADIKEGTRLLDVEFQNLPVYLISHEYSPRSVEFLKSRK